VIGERELRLFDSEETALVGGIDGFGAVGDVEFAEDGLDVGLGGALADGQGGADLLVRKAAREQVEGFDFAGGEPRAQLAIAEAYFQFFRNAALAGVDAAHGGEELGVRRTAAKSSACCTDLRR
jgi:hypothetical protein